MTMEASTHAAQNERLPIRTVVQVPFFEQIRASTRVQSLKTTPLLILYDSTRKTDYGWEKAVPEAANQIRKQACEMKIKDGDLQKKLVKKGSKDRGTGVQLLASRSRRTVDCE